MTIDEVLQVIKAFFEALLSIIRTLKGTNEGTTESAG